MYESIASFHDFSTQLFQKLDKGELKEAAELLLGRAFATRLPEHIDPDQSNKVVNVVTQVQRLSKNIAGFEEAYNRMSEFVHPNAYGSVIHFHSLEGDHAVFYERANRLPKASPT